MTEIREIVLNAITSEEDLNGPAASFPARGYSYFKYGSSKWAMRFGGELSSLLDSAPDTIASSAYKYLPPAAHALATALHAEITILGGSSRLVQIYRGTLTKGDYAMMGTAEREMAMQENCLAVDPAHIEGQDVLVVDDIRVTGSHEASLTRFFERLNPARVTFAYIASIERNLALSDPSIEGRVNHTAVRTLADVASLIGYGEFILNARSCKFILAERHREQLPAFLAGLNHELLAQFYMGAIGDGYFLVPIYEPSFQLLKWEYDSRRELDAQAGNAALAAPFPRP